MSLVLPSRPFGRGAIAMPRAELSVQSERLVADISAQFADLPLAQVDEGVRRAISRIATLFDIDRGRFARIHDDGVLHEVVTWEQPGVPSVDGRMEMAERFPWMVNRATAGEPVCFSRLDEVPSAVDRATCRDLGTKSAVMVPFLVEGRLAGLIAFEMVRRERFWEAETIHRLRMVATPFRGLVARRESDEAQCRARPSTGAIVGQTPAIQRVLEQVEQVARTDSTVLLMGETGVGKEVFATHLHQLSARRGRPMVRVNCSAIPATLLESELFGREKGAFTGALSKQIGRFELADRSTIFLDEIGELPLDVQVKLLRVLEEREIERLGSPRAIRIDTRIIAATHRNLEQAVADRTFREDLFYRLNVFPIVVPPLRDHADDIPLLVWRFVDEFSRAFGKRIDAIPRDTMDGLQRYPWPGNIRELRNIVERAMIVATGSKLTIPLPSSTPTAALRSERLTDVERTHIRGVLEAAGWRIRGARGAADRLGLKATTLEARMVKLGLKRPQHGVAGVTRGADGRR